MIGRETEMLDKSIEFHKILMQRPSGTDIVEYSLPAGFHFTMYKKGDDRAWADIEHSVNEFSTKKKALDYFKKKYKPFIEELERRCIFVENADGGKIATFTVWWEYIGARRYPWISWVAVKPDYQGKGIGKALISRGMRLLDELEGDAVSFLKTQTWSYKAINIYLEQGYEIVRDKPGVDWDSGDYDKMMSVLNDYLR